MSDEHPILIRHSKAPTDDVMIQTMNENNWLEFLSDSISGTLENSQAANKKSCISKEGQWIRNIFRRLNKYFRVYSMLFEELATTEKKLLFIGAGNNRIKAYKFAEISFKNFASMEDAVSYEKLYFKMAEKYFATGKTPFLVPPQNLPEIKPVSLPNFSNLYREFSDTPFGIFHDATFSGSSKDLFLGTCNYKCIRGAPF